MYASWWTELWRGLSVAAVALLLGWLFDRPVGFMVAGLIAYLVYQLYQLYRFSNWYRFGRHDQPRRFTGIWQEIAQVAYEQSRKSRKRKKRVQKLIRRFNQFSEALPDATVVVDQRNAVVWSNAAAETFLGITARDVGRPITNLMRKPLFRTYLEGGRFDEPLVLESPVRADTILHIQVVPYGNKSKVLAARDMTRLYRLEAMRRDFVGNVSHELRTPLTVIHGYAEMLAADPAIPDAQRRMLQQVQEQSERMQRMVTDLLMLSQLETTTPQQSPQEVVDVTEIARALTRQAQLLSPDHHHRVTVEADSRFGLRGCPQELHSAFGNLVFNAVRYTPAGGAIRVRWYCDTHGGHFQVEDTGIGIAPEHIPRLTERFYRVDIGRSRASGGTGLGLAIVKHVLERHQAELRITSELGKGSTFVCDFPQARIVEIPAQASLVAG